MGRRIGALAGTRALVDEIEDLIGRGAVGRTQGHALITKLDAVAVHVNHKNINRAIAGLQAFIAEDAP